MCDCLESGWVQPTLNEFELLSCQNATILNPSCISEMSEKVLRENSDTLSLPYSCRFRLNWSGDRNAATFPGDSGEGVGEQYQQTITCFLFCFKWTLIFRVVLGSQKNWVEGTDIPYTSLSHTRRSTPPLIHIPHQVKVCYNGRTDTAHCYPLSIITQKHRSH
jgi:hypothetical protein